MIDFMCVSMCICVQCVYELFNLTAFYCTVSVKYVLQPSLEVNKIIKICMATLNAS